MMRSWHQNTRIVLTADFPEYGLMKGDLAVILEIQSGGSTPDEFLIQVSNASDEAIAVFPAHEWQIRELRRDEILHVRPLQTPVLAEPVNGYTP